MDLYRIIGKRQEAIGYGESKIKNRFILMPIGYRPWPLAARINLLFIDTTLFG
jgi:hypothetical protein